MNLEGLRRPEGISSNIPDLMPLDFFFFKTLRLHSSPLGPYLIHPVVAWEGYVVQGDQDPSGASLALSLGRSEQLLLVQASVQGQAINVHMQLNKKTSLLKMSLSPRRHGNQRCVTASDIMVNASAPEQKQETGAVLGRVLFHTLQGRCVVSRSLPKESFFLDYMMTHLELENFTAMGKFPSGREEQKYG